MATGSGGFYIMGRATTGKTTKAGETMSRDELAIEQARITAQVDGIVGKKLNQTQFLLLVNRFREWDENQKRIIKLQNEGEL